MAQLAVNPDGQLFYLRPDIEQDVEEVHVPPSNIEIQIIICKVYITVDAMIIIALSIFVNMALVCLLIFPMSGYNGILRRIKRPLTIYMFYQFFYFAMVLSGGISVIIRYKYIVGISFLFFYTMYGFLMNILLFKIRSTFTEET